MDKTWPSTAIAGRPSFPTIGACNVGRTWILLTKGKEGTVILMFTSCQRRILKSLERDVACKFEFVSPPATKYVFESSAEQVVPTLNGFHLDSIEFFTPIAYKLIEEQGTSAFAGALVHLSGFSQPPSS